MSNKRYNLTDSLVNAVNGIINKPVVSESVEQIEELSNKTLKSYVKKSSKAADKAWERGDKEEDKAMSTDGEKYPEKQKRHMDAAGKQHAIWSKRDSGVKTAQSKLNKEDVDTLVYDEEFGIGEVIESNDTTATVVFEGRMETIDVEDMFFEDVEDLQEVSKDTLLSYQAKAKADPAFDKKKGKPSKATVAIRTKRTAGLDNAKAKLQAIVKKESDAHAAEMTKLGNKLNDHFHKEAPKILDKHGYKKVATGDGVETYIHPHENGHASMISLKRGYSDAYSYGSQAKASNSKGASWSTHYAHHGVYNKKGHDTHMTQMLPNFEKHVIDVKNSTDDSRDW